MFDLIWFERILDTFSRSLPRCLSLSHLIHLHSSVLENNIKNWNNNPCQLNSVATSSSALSKNLLMAIHFYRINNERQQKQMTDECKTQSKREHCASVEFLMDMTCTDREKNTRDTDMKNRAQNFHWIESKWNIEKCSNQCFGWALCCGCAFECVTDECMAKTLTAESETQDRCDSKWNEMKSI